jgi:hypothetical protein
MRRRRLPAPARPRTTNLEERLFCVLCHLLLVPRRTASRVMNASFRAGAKLTVKARQAVRAADLVPLIGERRYLTAGHRTRSQ